MAKELHIPPPCIRPGKREIYLDLLRIISIFLVLLQHGLAFHFEATETSGYMGRVLVLCGATVAVPVFFMISGATLLNKEESLGQVWRRRVVPFALLMVFCFVVQGGVAWVEDSAPLQRLPDYIVSMGNLSPAWTHMWTGWFLWAYLAFLLLLPLVRVLAKGMSNRMFLYLIALQVAIVGLFPTLMALVRPTGNVAFYINNYLPFFCRINTYPYSNMAWLFYVLTGYYLAHRVKLEGITKKRLWLLGGVAAACILMEAFLLEYVREARHAESIENYRVPVAIWDALPAIFLFVWMRAVCSKVVWPAWVGKVSAWAASGVLLLFLFENIFRHYTNGFQQELCMAWGGGIHADFCSGIAVRVLILIAGLALGMLLKQLPGARKLL